MFNSSTKYAALVLGMCALCISACKKENTTSQPSNDHHIIRAEVDASTYTTFEYNSDNQLTKIFEKGITYNNTTTLSYSANKKIDIATSGNTILKFSYNNSILSKVEYHINSIDGALTSYYDFVSQNGKVAGFNNYVVHATGNVANYKVEYTYNASGDIVTEKQYLWSANKGQFSIYQTKTYEYDNKVNPFAVSSEIGQIFFENASPHNPVKETFKDALDNIIETDIYSYTYDSFGYPTMVNVVAATPADPKPAALQIKLTYNN